MLEIAAGLKLSERGEIEITDVNRAYMELGELRVERMGRGYAWLDTGTHMSLIEAASLSRSSSSGRACQIPCPEEIAFRKNFISREQLYDLAYAHGRSEYGRYLLELGESVEEPNSAVLVARTE